MDQADIIAILNRHIFGEVEAALLAELLSKIADEPNRFVGIFRSTTPKLKLMQNVLQSREIRFGDALEEIITDLIASMGFQNLNKAIRLSNGDELLFDQHFCSQDQEQYYLVEQKVRDDHDSTKKRGQIDNFERKVGYLRQHYGARLIAIMYFIDPSLTKNRDYYREELNQISEKHQVTVHLHYNGELFSFLHGSTELWDNLETALVQWRKEVPVHIDFNFDAEPEKTLRQIAELAPNLWFKIASDNRLWEGEVITTLFPRGSSLWLLCQEFRAKGSKKFRIHRGSRTYQELAAMLQQKLHDYYPDQYPPPDNPQNRLL